MLENRFYKIISAEKDGSNGTYRVAILPDCDVYEGHFPGDPVCPGVCNIQTIKECASDLMDRDLRIKTIKQCRLTAIATPNVCPEVTITIAATPNEDGTASVVARIADEKQTYMDFKGTLQ